MRKGENADFLDAALTKATATCFVFVDANYGTLQLLIASSVLSVLAVALYVSHTCLHSAQHNEVEPEMTGTNKLSTIVRGRYPVQSEGTRVGHTQKEGRDSTSGGLSFKFCYTCAC